MPSAEEWAIHDYEGFDGIELSEYVFEFIRDGQTYGCRYVVTQTMRVSMSLTLNREETA